MRGKIYKTGAEIKRVAKEYVKSNAMCFDCNSTEKWVRIYAGKRYETFEAVQRYDYDNILPKKFRKIFVDTFTEGMLEVIEQKKKEHAKKEAEERAKRRDSKRKGKK